MRVTSAGSRGTRFALLLPEVSGMLTYRCRFCQRVFVWETAGHAFVWSRILIHLADCPAASWLTHDQRSIEARRATNNLLGPPAMPADQPPNPKSRGKL